MKLIWAATPVELKRRPGLVDKDAPEARALHGTDNSGLRGSDGDGDGALRGAEHDGLRVWFDANGNGRSEPGEVRDLGELGIVAIAVRAVTRQGVHPTNPRGLQLKDGRTLPTWDWFVEPVEPPKA